MQNNQKTTNAEKVNFKDIVNDFIQRNRKVIFSITGAIVLLFAGSLVFIAVRENMNRKAIEQLEELNTRFDELRFLMTDDYYKDDIDDLLADLETFAKKNSGFPGSKGWSIIGNIYSLKEDWSMAEHAFLEAARVGNRTYLAPLSLFNAAAAAEEQGNYELAISLLQQSIAHRFEFPAAARAQFSIGRLNEQLGNNSGAIEAYREVLINYQDMPVWQQLARSRIISLEIN